MSSYHSMNRMSTYSARKSMTPSMTSHDSCSRRISVAPSGRKSMVSRRNGLDDDYGRQSFAQKNFALQTCTETGVGDCPACLGAKSNCHRDTCELCCEKNTCGPNFKNCPYAPEAEVQTDPICLFSNLPCQCSDPCDLSPCMIAERCGFTGVDCRCIERACNTSKHCIIVDDEELCPATDVECRCVDKGCGTYSTCIVYEEESDDPDNDYYSQQQDDFYDEFTATDYCPNEPPGLYTAEDIIARCHALCQTDNTQNQPDLTYIRKPQAFCKSRATGPRRPRTKSCPKTNRNPRPKSHNSGEETDHYDIIIEEEEIDTPQKTTSKTSIRTHSSTKIVPSDMSRKSSAIGSNSKITALLNIERTTSNLRNPSTTVVVPSKISMFSERTTIKTSQSKNCPKHTPKQFCAGPKYQAVPCKPKRPSKCAIVYQ